MNDQVQEVVAGDLVSVTVVVLVDSSDDETMDGRLDLVGQESGHEVDGSLDSLMLDELTSSNHVSRGSNGAGYPWVG